MLLRFFLPEIPRRSTALANIAEIVSHGNPSIGPLQGAPANAIGLPLLLRQPYMQYPIDFQHPCVTRSNRFIMAKMNTAESRQSTTSTPQTIQSGIPVPQMRAITLVR